MFKNTSLGTSLAVQSLRLCASNTGGACLIPGQGIKIPHAVRHGQKIKNNYEKKIFLNLSGIHDTCFVINHQKPPLRDVIRAGRVGGRSRTLLGGGRGERFAD